MRSAEANIRWDGQAITIIDQTLLPNEYVLLRVDSVDDLAERIRILAVRGAMALGVVGALGIAMAAKQAAERGEDANAAAQRAGELLRGTRPTAVNLAWGIDRVLSKASEGPAAMEREAVLVLEQDIDTNEQIALNGLAYLQDLGRSDMTVLTHCNAGALVGADVGTVMGVIRAGFANGLIREVLTCETRPLLQGARLTAWELDRHKIPFRVLVDGAAAGLITRGLVDFVLVGADRVAANGDVANKVGTLAHALAASFAGIPFLVAAPESTVDLNTASGDLIPIEERPADEVLGFGGVRTAVAGARAVNPAFDVTRQPGHCCDHGAARHSAGWR
jgi:methylthioribose-1-phosphate isomerase